MLCALTRGSEISTAWIESFRFVASEPNTDTGSDWPHPWFFYAFPCTMYPVYHEGLMRVESISPVVLWMPDGAYGRPCCSHTCLFFEAFANGEPATALENTLASFLKRKYALETFKSLPPYLQPQFVRSTADSCLDISLLGDDISVFECRSKSFCFFPKWS